MFLFKHFTLRIELGLERTSDGRRSDGRRAIQSYFKTTRRAIHSMAGWYLYLWHMQLLQCIVVFLWHLQLLWFCNFLSSFHGAMEILMVRLFIFTDFFRFVSCFLDGSASFTDFFHLVSCIASLTALIWFLCSALLCHMRGEECKCCFQFNSRFPSTSTVRKHQLIIRMDSFFFF